MIAEAFDSNNDFGFTFVDADYIARTNSLTSTDDVKVLKNEIAAIKSAYAKDLKDLEKLILPLLRNLLKNPEKDYILWKDREKPIQAQIAKIMEITEKQV